MQFTAIALVALASFAAAAPGKQQQCKPATYRCLPNHTGWQVCDTSGHYVFAGTCPPKTTCKFDEQNQSPYCVPPGFTISS